MAEAMDSSDISLDDIVKFWSSNFELRYSSSLHELLSKAFSDSGDYKNLARLQLLHVIVPDTATIECAFRRKQPTYLRLSILAAACGIPVYSSVRKVKDEFISTAAAIERDEISKETLVKGRSKARNRASFPKTQMRDWEALCKSRKQLRIPEVSQHDHHMSLYDPMQ